MKLFLTGQPHSGKSTLLAALIDGVGRKQGFVTGEILSSNDSTQRVGFELINAEGGRVSFAHIDSPSKTRVSKYGVDTVALDTFLTTVENVRPGQLLYVDEIGQMQLYSQHFQDLVKHYLAAPNDFIGTLSSVYEHSFITEMRHIPDVEIIEVTPKNRDQLLSELQERLLRYL